MPNDVMDISSFAIPNDVTDSSSFAARFARRPDLTLLTPLSSRLASFIASFARRRCGRSLAATLTASWYDCT